MRAGLIKLIVYSTSGCRWVGLMLLSGRPAAANIPRAHAGMRAFIRVAITSVYSLQYTPYSGREEFLANRVIVFSSILGQTASRYLRK